MSSATLDALSQTRSELVAAIDAIVSERALSSELRQALAAVSGERDELAASCIEARRSLIDADSRAAGERRAVDAQLRDLRVTIAERDAALAQAAAAAAPMRDIEQLRQSVREEFEAPLRARVSVLENIVAKERESRFEAERARDVSVATAAASATQAAREADAMAEAHAAACAALNARIGSLEMAADETAAEAGSSLRRMRDEVARLTARARSLEDEAAALRIDCDICRSTSSRSLAAASREASLLRDNVRTLEASRAEAQRLSEASASEVAALRETAQAQTQRIGELTADVIRFESALRLKENNDESSARMAVSLAADARAEAARSNSLVLERAARAEALARAAEESLQKERRESMEHAALCDARVAAAEEATKAAARRTRTALGREALATRLLSAERQTRGQNHANSSHLGAGVSGGNRSVDATQSSEATDGVDASFVPSSVKIGSGPSRRDVPLTSIPGARASQASPNIIRRGMPPLPAPTPMSAAFSGNVGDGDQSDDANYLPSGGVQAGENADEGGIHFEHFSAEDDDDILAASGATFMKLRSTLSQRDGEIAGLRRTLATLRAEAVRANAALASVHGVINDALRVRSEAEQRAALAESRLGAADAAAREALARAVKAEAAASASADRATLESGSSLRAAHDARATVLAAVDEERAAAAADVASSDARAKRANEALALASRKAAAYKTKLLSLFSAFSKVKAALAERDSQLAHAETELARALRNQRV